MNSGKHKSGTRSRNGFPFICLNRPFVGYNITSIYPFIWKKLPFVSFRGFTLVELIITLTIAGILMAFAAPPLRTFVTSNRLSSQINGIIADITIARNEAIKRSVLTGVCTTAVGGTSCVSSGNWANGWLVYYCADETSTTTCAASAKTTIKLHEQLTGKNTLTGPASEIVYRKDGIILSGTGQFTLTDPKTGKKRIVCIVSTGRPSLSEVDC